MIPGQSIDLFFSVIYSNTVLSQGFFRCSGTDRNAIRFPSFREKTKERVALKRRNSFFPLHSSKQLPVFLYSSFNPAGDIPQSRKTLVFLSEITWRVVFTA